MSTRWEGVDIEPASRLISICNWCNTSTTEPVRDPVAVSWIGAFATTWCSQGCMDAEAEHRINAAGNDPS